MKKLLITALVAIVSGCTTSVDYNASKVERNVNLTGKKMLYIVSMNDVTATNNFDRIIANKWENSESLTDSSVLDGVKETIEKNRSGPQFSDMTLSD
ncbi:hypothetical protein [Vibrio agarivorans]|uniref:hypothetical protein n=1 Tax=Vibrio agarivorans TaxID=153622 RepID=UPI00222ED92B|nr:hypothetical protein [Vibrio agarivorans]